MAQRESFVTTIFRTIEFLGLSLWLGADAFLSFVVAPGAFAILGNRDAAGMMVGYSLVRLHFAGIFLGLVFLVARLARTHDFSSFTGAAALCVVLMVLLTATSQFTVSGRMETLKKEMVSVQNTPETDLFAGRLPRSAGVPPLSGQGKASLISICSIHFKCLENCRESIAPGSPGGWLPSGDG
jgi:hypothetical protein